MQNKLPKRLPLDFLVQAAAHLPDAPALKTKDAELTYGRLLERVRRGVDFFKGHGVAHGNKVAIYTDDELEMIGALFSLWAIGAVCIPINITQKPGQLVQVESIAEPDMGFYSPDYPLEFDRNYPFHPLLDGDGGLGSIQAQAPGDVGIIMFTSGTSGVPKAVPLTNWAIGHNAAETAHRLELQPDDRLFINTPPYTTSSIMHMLTVLSAQAAIVIERGLFLGSGIVDQIRDHNCTGFGGVPVHFMRLSAALETQEPPDTLRFLMNSGDHLPVSLIKKLQVRLPRRRIYCVYGLTEVAGRLCILSSDMLTLKIGSVGRPLAGMTITVRNENGETRPPFEQGEVFVKGPCLMEGYLKNPEKNREVMKPYGFATGDYGYLDKDGCLFLQGRRDDIVKVGGEKVSLNLIEDAIYGVEDFKEFVLAKIYDEHIGTVPCLFYVLREGKTFSRQRLLKHLKPILPPTHLPARFVAVDHLPRTSSGKIIRSALPPHE